VTVTQVSTGCSATASGTLGQPQAVDNAVITVTPASCSGVNDGTISYNAEGGNPFPGNLYDFDWTFSPDGVQAPTPVGSFNTNPSDLVALAAGFYNVTITDMNGCTFTDQVEITNNVQINLDTVALFNVSCNGSSDGSISIEMDIFPVQPNPSFSFFWNGPCTDSLTSTTTGSILTDLCPGNYAVFALDANGCSDTASFTINEPPGMQIDAVLLNNPTCTGINDGAITVQASGGNGMPFNYVWGDNVPGPARTGLAEGSYCVFVTDANNCLDSLCFDLALPLPPTIVNFDSTSVTCGSDGCLTVNAPTATSFQWTTLSGTPVGNTDQICMLDGDTYVVVVTDANNCMNTDTVTLATQDTMFFSDTTFTLPSCFNYPDGSIAVGVMGGNQPIQVYEWDALPGVNTSILAPVAAGTYTVTVTDLAGCTLVGSFELLNPAPIVSNIQILNPIATCSDSCDGAAIISAFYGGMGPGGIFNYAWEDGSTDSSRVDLCPGYTSITITDVNSCFRIDSVFIGAPDPVTASSITAVDVTCFGGNDGQAFVEGTGGTPGYTYLWETNETTQTIMNLTPTNYQVTITDSQGCTGVENIDVGEPDPITVTSDPAALMEIACFGDEDGELGALVDGGTPLYSYQWSDGTNIIGNTPIVTDLTGGLYFVTVTDANGCTGETQVIMPTPPPIVGSVLPWEELNCNGDQTTLNIDTIFGGAGGPFQYSLDFGVTLDPGFPITMSGGEHYVTYFDRDNCEFTDTIFVFEPEQIEVIFTSDVVEIELGDDLVLDPSVIGGAVDSLVWTPAEFLSNPDTLYPTATIYDSETFLLQVWDANGCMGEGSVFVRVDPNRNVYVPNVFKAGNTSGLNDHFNVFVGKGVELVNYMQVYDRWGELMYERTNFYPNNDILSEGWDGRYRGSFVDPGVYIYIIEVKFLDGRELLYRGDVTIVR
jgi:hypothetical protein